MYAVVRVAGFQYRIEPDQIVRVPRLDAPEGGTVTLDEVLLVGDGANTTVGRPTVEGARVEAEVVAQGRTPKLVAGKFKRRRKYRRRWGHRQDYTDLRIARIEA
jgi:large subunit ribosomal protein L21